MQIIKSISALALCGVVAACATSGANVQPVIDGPVGPNYSSDLAACQSLAASTGTFDSNTATNAATTAAVAAGGTALISNRGTNVRDAALIGGAAALAGGALQQQQNKEAIVRNCMRQRGYNVVG